MKTTTLVVLCVGLYVAASTGGYNPNQKANWGTWYTLSNGCRYTPASPEGVPANGPAPGTSCDWVTTQPECEGYGCNANDCGDGEIPAECGPLFNPNKNRYLFGQWVRSRTNPDCCYTPTGADGWQNGEAAPGTANSGWVTTQPTCPGYWTGPEACPVGPEGEEEQNVNKCGGQVWRQNKRSNFGVWYLFNDCCYTPASAEGVGSGWANRPSDGERDNCDWVTVHPSCPGYGCNANDCENGETPRECGNLWNANRNRYNYGVWVRNPDGCCYTPRNEDGVGQGIRPGAPGNDAYWITTDPNCPGYPTTDCDPHENSTPEEHNNVACSRRTYNFRQDTAYGVWVVYNSCCYTPAAAEGVPKGWSNRPSDGERTNCDWITTDPACPGYGCRANDCGPTTEEQPPQHCGPIWRSDRNYAWGQWVRNADGCCYTTRLESGAPQGSAPPGTEAGRAIWVTTDPNCPGYDGQNCPETGGETPEETPNACGGRNYRSDRDTSYGTWVHFQGCCYTPFNAEGVPRGWANRPSDGERENCDWITVDPVCPGYGCRANDCSGSDPEQVAPNCGPRWRADRAHYPWGIWVRNADGCCYTPSQADGVPQNVEPGTAAGSGWWTTTDPACPGYQGGSGNNNNNEDNNTGNYSSYCGAYEWVKGKSYPWATYVFINHNGKECCYAAFVYPEVPGTEMPGMSGCWITTDPTCPGWGGGAD